MKKIILALLLSIQAFSQYPQISVGGPARPSMQVGSTLSNIGTATAYTSSGAPGVIATSVVGDIDIDTTNKVVYVCTAGNAPCTTWQYTAPPVNIPVSAFGVNGTGSTDPANFSQAVSIVSGVGCLYIPAGQTVNLSLQSISQLLPANTCIKGDGPTSVIQGGTGLFGSEGILETTYGTSNVEIAGLSIQGACTSTSPTGVLFSTAASNGVNYSGYINESSIYIFGNISNIYIHDVTINHTCGYAIYGDTSTGNISNVTIQRVSVTNSRQFTFGNNSSYLVYGSWIGGMLFYGAGTTYNYQNLTVDNCTFQNVTGNALWTHVGTLSLLNQNVAFTNNTCIDCGLDFIQAAAIDGYTETGNRSIRDGYVVTSDIGGTRVGGPAWLQGETPVSFDTSGEVINAVRKGNVVLSENGEGFDGDGLGESVIQGNQVESCFASPDPLANSSSCGPYTNPSTPVTSGANNYVRCISTSNSSGVTTKVGQNLSILGNNCVLTGGGGVESYGIQNSIIASNTISQPAISYSNPIEIGNLGTNSWQHATGNYITGNTIIWSPSVGSYAVFQDGTYSPFFSTDVNIVRNNNLVGSNILEFLKCSGSGGCGSADPSASGTGTLTLSSTTAGADSDTSIILNVQGTTHNPYLTFYENNGAGTLFGAITPGGWEPQTVTFLQLPTVSVYPGSIVVCTNCLATGSVEGGVCASGGTAPMMAFSNGTAWKCF